MSADPLRVKARHLAATLGLAMVMFGSGADAQQQAPGWTCGSGGMGPYRCGRQCQMGPQMMGGSMARHHQAMMSGIPAPYNGLTNPLPRTRETVERGATFYSESCASCHGAGGLGNGEAGRELSPPPANLAMLVRMPMMRDDRYLFWAISEGGAAFGTAMPAFKDSLSAEEIWSVVRFLQAGLPKAGGTEAPK